MKDGWRDPLTGAETYVYPGDGPCRVQEILGDCIASGYEGWLTIEPHMAVVFHDASVHSPETRRRAIFVEYGHRLEEMLKRLGLKVEAGRRFAKLKAVRGLVWKGICSGGFMSTRFR